ncbi:MAG: hypothetical protein ACREMQ_20715 [Longimicrobiales bacterium]
MSKALGVIDATWRPHTETGRPISLVVAPDLTRSVAEEEAHARARAAP